jgi:hypothetical protein
MTSRSGRYQLETQGAKGTKFEAGGARAPDMEGGS